MSYRVHPVRRARKDADAIVDWIANQRRSPRGAAAWLKAYKEALASLSLWPESNSLAPEDEHDDRELRQFFFKTRHGRKYRGIFTICGDEVLVLRIRGPGQRFLEPDDIPGD